LKGQEAEDKKVLASIDPVCLRKINILTAKERPFCSFCSSLVGFTWFVRRVDDDEEEDKAKEEDKREGEGVENEDDDENQAMKV